MVTEQPIDVVAKGVGRPRSAEADQRILAAAFQQLLELGYARLSIEGVAETAGVGKTTIYRRYPNKRELVASAIEQFVPLEPVPEVGDARAEIAELARRGKRLLISGPGCRLIGMLLAEEVNEPDLLDFFRQRIIWPRRAIIRRILERGIERGQVRADLDVEVAIDALMGSFIARHLAGVPIEGEWSNLILKTLWPAFRAESSGNES